MKSLRDNRTAIALALVLSASLIPLAIALSYLHFSAAAAAYQPQQQPPSANWSTIAAPLRLPRSTFTRLHNGSVIAVGGNAAEIYYPVTREWRDVPERMTFNRDSPDAHLLPDGRLLVIGGFKGGAPDDRYAGPPEIYDPATGKWTIVNTTGVDLKVKYSALLGTTPITALLPNGKVLIVDGSFLVNSALLDLATGVVELGSQYTQPLNAWFNTGSSSLTVLFDGKVLLKMPKDTLIYDPENKTWTPTAVPNNNGTELVGRINAKLPNGSLFFLLNTAPSSPSQSFFSGIFDPVSRQWGNYAARDSRGDTIVALTNGEVLTIDYEGWYVNLYDPAVKSWRYTMSPYNIALGPAVLLADGKVLSGNQVYGANFGSIAAPTAVNTSAASFRVEPLAKGSIASIFGTNLSGTVRIKDQSGIEHEVNRIFAATSNQINYLAPDNIPSGQAEMIIGSGQTQQRALLSIVDVAPGVFTANADGRGVPAAVIVRVKADGSQTFEPVASFDSATGRFIPIAVDLGSDTEAVFLALFGTGARNRTSLENTLVYIGGVKAPVQFIGAQSGFDGLDQINVQIPRSLSGRGDVDVLVTVDGKMANPVGIKIN